jgi:hypothetical protein
MTTWELFALVLLVVLGTAGQILVKWAIVILCKTTKDFTTTFLFPRQSMVTTKDCLTVLALFLLSFVQATVSAVKDRLICSQFTTFHIQTFFQLAIAAIPVRVRTLVCRDGVFFQTSTEARSHHVLSEFGSGHKYDMTNPFCRVCIQSAHMGVVCVGASP